MSTEQTAQAGQTVATTTDSTAPKQDAVVSSSQTTETEASKLLAGRFKNQGDLKKAISSLEEEYKAKQAEYTKLNQELAELRKTKAAPVAEEPSAEPQVKEAPKANKETPAQKQARIGEALMQEYMTKGSLSEATRIKAVEELGLPAHVVADFEHFLAKKVETGLQKIKATFAEFGDFDINAVIDEMNTTLPPERLNAIKTLVDAGDIEVLRPYIKSHVKGKLPEAEIGRPSANGGGGFKSKEEMNKALDRRMGVDMEYTSLMQARLDATPSSIRGY